LVVSFIHGLFAITRWSFQPSFLVLDQGGAFAFGEDMDREKDKKNEGKKSK
jgi:hypothetical protein